jgi:hypothetical protein
MPRMVEPELLDALQPEDSRAVGSRRDLRRINTWMRQSVIMARLLGGYGRVAPRTILELGAGDGTFMLGVAKRIVPAWSGVTVRMVDRQDLVTAETERAFADIGWTVERSVVDVLDTASDSLRDPADIVTANLFLHHFQPAMLKRILTRVAGSASYVAACEPRRSVVALAASRMIFMIGCNAVSRHDAVTSVRAGFRDRELSELWPSPTGIGAAWRLDENAAGLFTHTFVAKRDVSS